MGSNLTIWLVYLAAAVVFYWLFWRLTDFRRRGFSYPLRAVMAAIIFTPWYANSQDATLAPALMVVLMDTITIGSDAAVRAFVPLFLAVVLAIVLSLVVLLVKKAKKS